MVSSNFYSYNSKIVANFKNAIYDLKNAKIEDSVKSILILENDQNRLNLLRDRIASNNYANINFFVLNSITDNLTNLYKNTGSYIALMDPNVANKFSQLFYNSYNYYPSFLSMVAFDILSIISKYTKSNNDIKYLKSWLNEKRVYYGAIGKFSIFNSSLIRKLHIFKINNNTLINMIY